MNANTQSEAIASVQNQAARLAGMRLPDLFAADPGRAAQWTIDAPYLKADFSKQRINRPALAALAALAEATGLEAQRRALFAGAAVNATEGRPAWHTALRAASPPAEVAAVREKMRNLANARGDIRAVVHVGVGGSELGPRLVADALYRRGRRTLLRFAANVDGEDLADALEGLDPETTLVVVCSKTFTTLETSINGAQARLWLGPHAARNLAAVTAAPQRAAQWGVPEGNIFPFWDWVGGRYSVWSAIGLSLVLTLEPGAFDAFLAGAAAMDEHFASAPFSENLPAIAGALQFWNREALGRDSYAVVPYAHRLKLLPAFLQQLEMESNGKGVDNEGRPLQRPAAFVTWGEPGTNAQHSFFQMLHQGVNEIPVEFIALGRDGHGAERQAALQSNLLAQARALMVGRSLEETKATLREAGRSETDIARLAPHQTFRGDRASTILAIEELTPAALGALLAFYEHRTFVQGVFSQINSFDQFGVELGKQVAQTLAPALSAAAPPPAGLDGSTLAWLARWRQLP